MSKGQSTRKTIINEALKQSVSLGVERITLGTLADSLNVSKSGLYAHFKSKEALQVAIVEEAIERFGIQIRAAVESSEPGKSTLQALFNSHLDWIEGKHSAGGCVFVIANQEFSNKPGPVHDALETSHNAWRYLLAESIREAVRLKQLSKKTRVEVLVFEIVGLALSYQLSADFLNDEPSRKIAEAAFEKLLQAE